MENQQVAKKKGLEYWQQIIIMLCLGWTVIWIYRSALSPIFPELNLSLGGGISDSSLGAIASFYFFGYTGMQIPAGILVDKFGKKMVLIPGFTLFALAAIVIANANGITMVYAGSLMAGIGCGSYYGSAYSLSSESIPQERRGLSTAIINSGSAVGMGIGLILSSLLVKQLGLPWQIMMYLVAILVVLIMIVFIKVIRTTPDAVVNHPTAKAKHDPEDKVSMSTLFAPHMIASYVLYFATCYGYYMVVTWLPSFLQQERGFEGVAIGFSSALVAFSAIPGALFFSRLSDKFQDKKIQFIVVLELLAAAMLVLTVMAPTSGVLLVGLVLYGLLGKLAVEPIIISYIGDTAPKKGYGTTFGVFNFFGMSSSVLAPWVTGVISDATGSKVNGFFLSAIIMVVGTVLFLGANIMMKNKKAKAK
ncbi:MFS transporter [Carnobacterium maltaromaticum]|jgi:MFS family permease|uniref:Sugar (And other) transporter family protein n=1 Tax=Carnobacterium maltaromaticum LMA28 TaxID=1234679 RepID=K8E488_CARML|nr:MFS transporter [Carnobacterium maltaromaticum]AOA02089.1 MFS transporter [Carnobacterium maltaromaticum]MBC9787371.1 MFS transporter [Carnobacterium maltaromaticum]MCI1819985.1 MFS transporter [Carnobacterium maltaromaticum]CCO11174.2 sugar (and other) transporter family protein [Carnobacterium maltaromaticum LMA28]